MQLNRPAADKITNPNCSVNTMAIHSLHKKANIANVIVCTTNYHRTGVKAESNWKIEYAGVQGEMAYKYPIHRK
jgi:aspartate-semialdehyde dehydrogenase